ncbi:MAG TPA: folylpolyglutamate synthase/dihydrofolate synthase family protein, partial [Vicinamibacterales bacterium]|nr:folylpolyglutamate synthase/dihydrofolate synthase family protein [Vicinamibacterales bacterium]
ANIARLCETLGHPEERFPSVLIGGTNGKGSVTAMVETALRTAGHRTGRYTSPHLLRLEERFVISGVEATPAALDAAAARVQRAALDLVASGTLESLPTFFECTTAVAFELFREARVEIAVLEVGLGGRLDATNIVSPVVAAIVSIDIDHEAQLGSTIPSIAAEKAGIVKPGIPVVCGRMPREALDVIRAVCTERGATLIRADEDRALAARLAAMPLSLAGEHQRANAAVAVTLLEVLDAKASVGIHVDADAIRAGLTSTVWPGRLERFTRGSCRLLLDAAHNPAGARALAEYLRSTEPQGVTLVFGAMKDKAISEMLSALASAARTIVCTTAPSPRAASAMDVAAMAERLGLQARPIADPFAAIDHACSLGSPVVVAGSIFLIGPVREWLARDILR